ncbi:ester cyclase [Streptomyces sp. 4N509B]|uniref:ester cyclase n=1 Tax=Streptomyces sp. 4N509B TaxID=3457413 RepID=UPI003FD395A3
MSDTTLFQRYVRALGEQDWELLRELYTPDVVMYAPSRWGAKGIDFVLAFCQQIHSAHPGIRVVLHDEFYSADGTRGAVRFALHWHNTGTFFGKPATGERGISIEQHTVRVEDGRIAEQVAAVSTLHLHTLQKEAWGMDHVRDVADPAPAILSVPAPATTPAEGDLS